ncbi:UNVERIFIED_CONTAM: hypothetical protein FKN15_072390 [Acipenser sinensis]
METSQSAESREFQYPAELRSAQARKHLRTYINVTKRGICQGRQILLREDSDPDSTVLSINVYHSGTVLIQGSEASLTSFEKTYKQIKEAAEIEKTHTTANDPENTDPEDPEDPTSDSTTPDTNLPTPTTPSDTQHMRECLALLELEFVEFRELTLARLTETSITQQLRDEVSQLKRENRVAITELTSEVKDLQQENESLRAQLTSVKEEMQRREKTTNKELQGLREQLHRYTAPPTPAPRAHSQEQGHQRKQCPRNRDRAEAEQDKGAPGGEEARGDRGEREDEQPPEPAEPGSAEPAEPGSAEPESAEPAEPESAVPEAELIKHKRHSQAKTASGQEAGQTDEEFEVVAKKKKKKNKHSEEGEPMRDSVSVSSGEKTHFPGVKVAESGGDPQPMPEEELTSSPEAVPPCQKKEAEAQISLSLATRQGELKLKLWLWRAARPLKRTGQTARKMRACTRRMTGGSLIPR